jgi:hypothetical protein
LLQLWQLDFVFGGDVERCNVHVVLLEGLLCTALLAVEAKLFALTEYFYLLPHVITTYGGLEFLRFLLRFQVLQCTLEPNIVFVRQN